MTVQGLWIQPGLSNMNLQRDSTPSMHCVMKEALSPDNPQTGQNSCNLSSLWSSRVQGYMPGFSGVWLDHLFSKKSPLCGNSEWKVWIFRIFIDISITHLSELAYSRLSNCIRSDWWLYQWSTPNWIHLLHPSTSKNYLLKEMLCCKDLGPCCAHATYCLFRLHVALKDCTHILASMYVLQQCMVLTTNARQLDRVFSVTSLISDNMDCPSCGSYHNIISGFRVKMSITFKQNLCIQSIKVY